MLYLCNPYSFIFSEDNKNVNLLHVLDDDVFEQKERTKFNDSLPAKSLVFTNGDVLDNRNSHVDEKRRNSVIQYVDSNVGIDKFCDNYIAYE